MLFFFCEIWDFDNAIFVKNGLLKCEFCEKCQFESKIFCLWDFEMWFLWKIKMRFGNYDFCSKWVSMMCFLSKMWFWNMIFVKKCDFKMWILLKGRFWKCKFLEICDFGLKFLGQM